MSSRIRDHLRSNVIGYICLFWLMAGTAIAASNLPKSSVTSKAIKNGQVKTADLATGAVKGSKLGANAVNGSKVADESLTGSDLLESSLGQVPSAALADTATTAADAALLDGIDSTGFTSAGEIHSSGRVALDDPTGGGATLTANLIDTGTFTVKGRCLDNGGSRQNDLIIDSTVAGWSLISDPAGISVFGLAANAPQVIDQGFGIGATPAQMGGDYIAISPNGEVLSGIGYAAANTQGIDCVFAASGIGF